MKILSIDTASDICGVSILENNNLIINLDNNTGRTHSENLMPMIEQAFIQTNLTLKDIDLLVCDKGPGSFTGIRIGVATIKAFHDSLSIPCIGISSLEALAYAIKENEFIFSILDCKNDNCYFALYELKNSQYTEIIPPSTDTITNALKMCKQNVSSSNICFVGDGSDIYKTQICSEFETPIFAKPENNLLNSYYLGLAGLSKWEENKLDDVLPLYLKKPQAQRHLENSLKDIKISNMTLEHLNDISDILMSDFDNFWNPSILKDELNCENSHYLVAQLNNDIVGFAGIKVILDIADIMNLVIKKDFRNQGIATLLLENIMSLSKKLKVSSLTLEVKEDNYPAIHLYKKFGFENIGTRKNYYKNMNGIIMTKNVNTSI